MKKTLRLDGGSARSLINAVDVVLFDCDGVLWREGKAIAGAARLVKTLIEAGKHVFYVTNNSTKSRHQYVQKCHQLGFTCQLDNIISTSYLVAQHLSSLQFDKTVYLVGSAGIGDELDAVGIRHTGLGPDHLEGDALSGALSRFVPDPQVGAVVVGFDGHFSYPKLLKAANYARQPDTLFLATNRDERFPTETLVIPGTGTMVASVAMGSGVEPLVLGKPSRTVFDAVQQRCQAQPERTLMIGDNHQTDIVFGSTCGLRTLCVLSGVLQRHQLQQMTSGQWQPEEQVADYWAETVAELLTAFDDTQ